jgi:hypothetical protein
MLTQQSVSIVWNPFNASSPVSSPRFNQSFRRVAVLSRLFVKGEDAENFFLDFTFQKAKIPTEV